MGDREREQGTDDEVLEAQWADLDFIDEDGKVWWRGKVAIEGKEDIDRINEFIQPYLGLPMNSDLVYKILSVLLDNGFSSRRGKGWL